MQLLKRAPESVLVWLSASIGSLLFLLLGPYSNFGPAGLLDPWFYTGYFTNFSYLVHHIGPSYFVSRLPWILPGVAAFHLFPPEPASVLLNLLIVTVSAVSLYWAVRWLYTPFAGAAAATFLVTNPYFMSTVCWDYPDGPAIAYAFAALAFAVRPHGARSTNGALTGVFLTLSGLTNLSGAPMLLAVGILSLYHHRQSPRGFLRECLYFAAGAIGITLALCPASQILFGRWTYFYWQIYQTIHTFGDPSFLPSMWGSGAAFLLTAYRLFAPALLLVLGPLYLIRKRDALPAARSAYLGLLLCFAFYTFQEFVLHGVALRVPYHSSYMLVPLFFFAGALTGEDGTSREEAILAAGISLVLALWFHNAAVNTNPWIILSIAGALVLAAFLHPRLPVQASLLAILLFLSPALDPATSYAWDRRTPVTGRNVDVFRGLMTLQSSLKPGIDPARRARFWYDTDEPLIHFYDSAESLYLWMHGDYTRDLATWPEAELHKQIPTNATLVHLTLHPERLPARAQLLASRGIQTTNERRWTLPFAGQTIHVILQDVTAPNSAK